MRKWIPIVSSLALAGVILPPLLFLAGRTPLALMQQIMLWATLVWFATTPFWMDRKTG